MKNLLFIFTILSLLCACGSNNPVEPADATFEVITPSNPAAKGDRILGINISESALGFSSDLAKAKEAGINTVELNIPWTAIETSEGVYEDPWGGILSATWVYGNEGIDVSFSLAVINTVTWEVPDYLKDEDANSAAFISAFNNMLDWFLENVPENVTVPSLSIGNEVDLVLNGADEWTKYREFYKAVAAHMKANHSNIKVGVKTTVMGGLFGDEATEVTAINEFSDVVMLNYYPQNAFFQVKDPEDVHTDFGTISSLFPNQEIWMTEIGFQSGSDLCMSSETKQAQFYHEMFTAWDAHKDHITHIMIDWLNDQSPAMINEWKSYYGDDPALVEYLSTLGLRNYDGTDKPAWLQVKEEANVRGWK